MVNKSGIGEVTIEQKDFKITIRQKEDAVPQPYAWPQVPQPLPQLQPPPVAPPSQEAAQLSSASQTPSKSAAADNANLITIKSPMIGTFYRRPSPDKSNFVEVGDEVSAGKVVCIIEAMKLFNEIESEVSGKVVKILVEDSSPVEYDQPLFLVEPS